MVVAFALAVAPYASGQVSNVTNMTSTPIPGSGHDYIQMLNETVNPANGSVCCYRSPLEFIKFA